MTSSATGQGSERRSDGAKGEGLGWRLREVGTGRNWLEVINNGDKVTGKCHGKMSRFFSYNNVTFRDIYSKKLVTVSFRTLL